jgi:hypothetical protein
MRVRDEWEALKIENLNWWARASYMASVAALFIAAFAFGYGAWVTHATQQAQTQALAVGIYQEYSKLSLQYPEFANWPEKRALSNDYETFAANAYFTAESLYNLTHGQPAWDSTVAGIIRFHRALVRDGRFACSAYSPGFVSFVRKVYKAKFDCAPA